MSLDKEFYEKNSADEEYTGKLANGMPIVTIPSDYIVKTIYDLIKDNIIEIPNFQRNYIWEQKRASLLIDSIIMGLPIPQVFFQVKKNNKYLVIDGHQRLMTIYYFMKGKFPKDDKRAKLRKIFDEHGEIPEEYFNNPEFFRDFKLKIENHPLNGKTYSQLGELKSEFDLKPIRGIGILESSEANTQIFEIFNRLNTGGVKVNSQELRVSIYNSDFFKKIIELNTLEKWRNILDKDELDLHMLDSELILRGFAVGENFEEIVENTKEFKKIYENSMTKFLNNYSALKINESLTKVNKKSNIFEEFIKIVSNENFLYGTKFSKTIYEIIFSYFYYLVNIENKELFGKLRINSEEIIKFKEDPEIKDTITSNTTSLENIKKRIVKIKEYQIFYME